MPEADVSLSVSARDAGFKAAMDALSRESRALEKDLIRMNAAFSKSGTGLEDLRRTEARYKGVRDQMTRLRAEHAKLARSAKTTGAAFTQMGGRINRAIGALNNPLLLAGGGIALAMFAKRAITAASDVVEAMNKTKVVFGSASDSVIAFADTAAGALGQSKAQALSAAANFASLGKAAGLTGNELATFAIDLTSLASDMASFNNTTVDEAIVALSAAMRGEYEPIRRFNVLLDAASLSQAAYAQGLTTTAEKVLPQSIKVQAAYAAILEQTTDQQGDFNRTSGEYANMSRIVAAEWTNLQAAIGEAFLPAAKAALDALRGLLAVLNKLPAPVRGTGVAIAAIGAALVLAVPRLMDLKAAILASSAASTVADGKFKTLRATMATLGSAAGVTALALTAAFVAWTQWNTKEEQVRSAAEEYAATLDPQTLQATGDSYQYVWDMLGKAVQGTQAWDHVQQASGITQAEATEAMIAGGDAAADLRQRLMDAIRPGYWLGDATTFADKALEDLYDTTGDVNRVVGDGAGIARNMADGAKAAADAAEEYAGQVLTAAEAQERLNQATKDALDLLSQLDARLSLRGAMRDFRAQSRGLQAEIDKAIKEAGWRGGPIRPGTPAGDALEGAVDKYASSASNAIKKLMEAGDFTGALTVAQQAAQDAKDTVDRMPMDPAAREQFLSPFTEMVTATQQALANVRAITTERARSQWLEIQERVYGSTPTGNTPTPSPSPGDTAAPWGTGPAGSALAFHASLGTARTQVTSGFRSHTLGSVFSDHLTGRAIDVAGANLPSYARAVKAVGGYAAFHGTGSSRHLHAVPTTRAAAAREPAAVATGPLIGSVVVNHPAAGIDVERAVSRAIARAERVRRERG